VKALICDYTHPVLITGLQQAGYTVTYAPEIERDELLQWLSVYHGIVINTKTVADNELIEKASSLKWIARLGSGLDIIDLKAAASQSIHVINTPQANANAVAEHVFGMLLSLLRNIPRADRQVREGTWNREQNRGIELKGRTVGIMGFGNNGAAFAEKFAGWDVRVLAYDKYKTHYAQQLPFVLETDLEHLLSESEILSLHLPLTDETRFLVDRDFLKKCKEGVILLNSSRGKIVRTSALVEALESGMVGGACLDVLENEKPASYSNAEAEMYGRLASSDRVILTPHIAGWTVESKERIALQIVKEVSELSGGLHF
jgi:D-3-phosphoglycerate dehydrogenase